MAPHLKSDLESLFSQIYHAQYSHNACIDGPFGEKIITYADYIASGQPLEMIEHFIEDKILPFYANTHTESSYTGLHSSHVREEARRIIKDSVNASDEDVVIFCGSGSTAAVDRMNRLLLQHLKKTGEKIIILHGPFEHHSNILPWREGNYETVAIAITPDGLLDMNDLKSRLEKYQHKGILIGSFSAASNVTGIIAPVDEITLLLHQYGAYSFWDYAAAAPYLKIDMNPGNGLQKEAVFISPHKFVGAPGSPGLLIAKKHLFDNEIPVIPGGGTVQFVTRTTQKYHQDIEIREEGGTPGIIESIRCGLAFKLKNDIGEDEIEKREKVIVKYAFDELLPNPNILILGNTHAPRLAFFAFHIRYKDRLLHHGFVIALLNDLFGIQARGGCSCAGPYGHDLLGISNEKSEQFIGELINGNEGLKPGWSRLNLNYFIPEFEMQFIVSAIQFIADYGYLFLKDYHVENHTALWKNIHFNEYKLNSLYDFKIGYTSDANEKVIDRKKMQLDYLSQAMYLAELAKKEWHGKQFQELEASLIHNSLRWYCIAQDVKI